MQIVVRVKIASSLRHQWRRGYEDWAPTGFAAPLRITVTIPPGEARDRGYGLNAV